VVFFLLVIFFYLFFVPFACQWGEKEEKGKLTFMDYKDKEFCNRCIRLKSTTCSLITTKQNKFFKNTRFKKKKKKILKRGQGAVSVRVTTLFFYAVTMH
jgi:hypothetical protein